MVFIYTAALLFLTLISGAESRATLQLIRDAPTEDEVCDKFYNLTSEFLLELKDFNVQIYMGVVSFAGMLVRVDIRNPEELRPLVCQLTALKTLKDLQQIFPLARNRPDRYDGLVKEYVKMQTFFGKIGGYTNIPRILKLAKDVRLWMMELPPEKSGLSEVADLDKLTDFFREMQVKYGSRWLSLVALSENQMVLIEDPIKMAKELHDCKTPGEVKDLLNIEADPAEFIFTFLLRNRSKHLDSNKDIHIFEVAARIVYGLGQIGLYTLAY